MGEPSERAIFAHALTLEGAARSDYLDGACGDDTALRQRIEDLISEEKVLGGDFLELPAADPVRSENDTVIVTMPTEKPGDWIDRFKLLQVVGEGGCGVVYLAEQEVPVRRRVALKVIKLGMDTKAVIARFEAERQALAMMDHPNIAKVLEAGATKTGRPYFVMELVRGVCITDYCDENQLSTCDRLELFIQVCHAIQHAHQKGVIHRDIKPSNILVTMHDGVPIPMVIDFGIAKATNQSLTEKTIVTEFHAFIGTPAYTSPEQAEMSNLDVDTRSDVYSLGVLLYEMLIGQTPFEPERLMQSSLHEMRRIIIEEEPSSPSVKLGTLGVAEGTRVTERRRVRLPALKEAVRGDLDWVVMKCLEKDRKMRYPTAHELALDVRRFLENEPVWARPPGKIYRLRKLYRKHRAACLGVVGVAAALVLGAGVSVWQAVRATHSEKEATEARLQESLLRVDAEAERARAVKGEEAARLSEYVADINLTRRYLQEGNLTRALALLDKAEPASDHPDLRGFEWRYLRDQSRGDDHVALPRHDGPVHGLQFSPDARLLAVNAGDRVFIWDAHTFELITALTERARSMVFSPDGGLLVTVNYRTLRFWDTEDWEQKRTERGYSGPLSISSDGRFLSCMKHLDRRQRSLVIWDLVEQKEVAQLKGASEPVSFAGGGKRVVARFQAGEEDDGIGSWSIDSLLPGGMNYPDRILDQSGDVFGKGLSGYFLGRTMGVSPDGRYLVAARNELTERGVFILGIWSMENGRDRGYMPKDAEHIEHTASISRLAFSPDGLTVATASKDYSIRLWDLEQREPLATLRGHTDEAWTVVFSPDGERIASGDKAGGVKLWSTSFRPGHDTLEGQWQPEAFSSRGDILAVMKDAKSLVYLDIETREEVMEFQFNDAQASRFGYPIIAMSGDLRLLAHAVEDGRVTVRDTETDESHTFDTGESRVDFVAMSPDGRTLGTLKKGRALRLWDRLTGDERVLEAELQWVQFSHDGQTLAGMGRDGGVQLWDVAEGVMRTNVVVEFGARYAMAFSQDDSRLAVGCGDDAIRLIDVATGAISGVFSGHKQGVFSVAFSPDGKTLATSSDDSTLKLWNVATQRELLSDLRHGGGITRVLFSPDGEMLIRGSTLFSQTDGLRFYHAPRVEDERTDYRVQQEVSDSVGKLRTRKRSIRF